MNAENETSKNDAKRSQNSRRQSARKSSHVLRQRKNRNKTVSQDGSPLSEKTTPTPNVTVLTPPPAISLHRTASVHEPCKMTLALDAAAATCQQTPPVPNIMVHPPPHEKLDDKAGGPLHQNTASDKSNEVNGHRENDEEGSDANNAACSVVTVPACRRGADQFAVPGGSTDANVVNDFGPKTRAEGSPATCDVRDTDLNIRDTDVNARHADVNMRDTDVNVRDTDVNTRDMDVSTRDTDDNARDMDVNIRDTDDNMRDMDVSTRDTDDNARDMDVNIRDTDDNMRDMDVNISDSSLHLDTQMLHAIAGQPAIDDNKTTNMLPPATVAPTAMTNSDKLMSENLLDTSSELDGTGQTSATCRFMKEFSTPKCLPPSNAAVARKVRDYEVSRAVTVETVRNPHAPHDLSVSVTSELLAASNFDRICAGGDNEMIAYSEEMFDIVDEPVPVQRHLTDKLSDPNKRIALDSVDVAEVCIADKSDLFASYVEEPDPAVRADVCMPELPAENSFGLAHDSITNTMFDRAMAVANQPAVGNWSEAVKRPSVSDAGAKPSDDVGTNFVADNDPGDPHADVPPPPSNTASPGIDAEAALHLLCESAHKSAKKPPKRRGRKRTSDSADPFCKPGTQTVEDKRRRTLSLSPQLPAESDRSDISLNEAICGHMSFDSASDSSAYVPPTPPSTATEKSNANTPRRLLGGVAGVTPVKSDRSVSRVSQVKKNISQPKGRKNKEVTQHKVNGVTETAVSNCEDKIDGISAPSSQGLQCSQSFTIIDVAANRLLFDTFIAEWQQQQSFSLSVACEKRAQNSRRSAEGIGAKFTRGNCMFQLGF